MEKTLAWAEGELEGFMRKLRKFCRAARRISGAAASVIRLPNDGKAGAAPASGRENFHFF